MDLFKGMFQTIFKTSATRMKMRTEAQVRRATIGKVQAKVNKKSEEIPTHHG